MTRPHDTSPGNTEDSPGKTPDTPGASVRPTMKTDAGPVGGPDDTQDGPEQPGKDQPAEPSAKPDQQLPLLRLGGEDAPVSDPSPEPQPEPQMAPDAAESDPARTGAETETPVRGDTDQPLDPDPEPDSGTQRDPVSDDDSAPAPEDPLRADAKAAPSAPVPASAPAPAPALARWTLDSDLTPDGDSPPDTGPDALPRQDIAAPASSPPEVPALEPDPEPVAAPTLPPRTRARPACEAALFGKLPTRGDFISRNMPRLLQRPFEDWLIPMVQEARKELGVDWNGHWRGAGPWRFWIGPDVLGGSWQRDLRKPAHEQAAQGGAVTGVLLPSADRHGRDFPLVLVLADPLARLLPPPVTASPDRGWYDLCDDLLYAARAGNDITTIEAALDRLPGPLLPEGAEDMAPLLDQPALWAQGTEVLEDGTSRIWRDIATADHHLAASGRSYWWQAPRSGAAQRVLSLAGLPDAGSFAFMLAQGHPDASNPLQ